MEFYQSIAGRQFFDGQLPKLISALEAIAKALQQSPSVKPTPPVLLTADVPDTFLRELYHGEMDPSGLPNGPEHEALTQQIKEFQDQLQADAGPKLWARIEDYRMLLEARGSAERLQAFTSGYRCAVRMVSAGPTQPQAADQGGRYV